MILDISVFSDSRAKTEEGKTETPEATPREEAKDTTPSPEPSSAKTLRTLNLAPIRERRLSLTDIRFAPPSTHTKRAQIFTAASHDSYMTLPSPKVTFPLPVQIVDSSENVKGSRLELARLPLAQRSSSFNCSDSPRLPDACSAKSRGGIYYGISARSHPRYSSATASLASSADSAYTSETSSLTSRTPALRTFRHAIACERASRILRSVANRNKTNNKVTKCEGQTEAQPSTSKSRVALVYASTGT